LNADKVKILNNSIHTNDRNGISLDGPVPTGPFFNPNDPGDVDVGPNDLMNFPNLTKASSVPGTVAISGEIFNGLPGTSFLIQFFGNDVCDSYGHHGEGKTYLGSISQLTDSNGNAQFFTTIGGVVPPGYFITATATTDDKTSEFSECVEVTEGQVTYSQELEEDPCDQFNPDEMTITTFEVRQDSGQFILYVKNSFPYPKISGENKWEYTATLGEIPSVKCDSQGFENRKYCDFIIPQAFYNTKQTLKLFSNLCINPFYINKNVSIFATEPAEPSVPDEPEGCHSDLGPRACDSAGGTYSAATNKCVCP